jgi:23S rRNA pseudouridine2457 synthase
MVSQFISPDKVGLLGDLDFNFPEGTHAIGRLDNESEGLLILTTNKKVTRLMYLGHAKHKRSYLVMVQNEVSAESLQQLKEGITIRVKGGGDYIAVPEDVKIIRYPTEISAQAIDPREQFPHTWLLITLTEGKFRQVRKMVLAIRHRCLRLIRISINDLALGNLKPGEILELDTETFCKGAGIDPARL